MTRDSKPVKNSQYGFMLWHGMTLGDLRRFFKKRPALHWTKMARLMGLPFSGAYNSLLGTLDSLIYDSRVRNTQIEQPPLFILGYWRSGTTLLHNLLHQDPNFQSLNTYQALFPSHFLLTEKLVTRIPLLFSSRPMDNMKVTWTSPQEDDMALCIQSQISAYMLLADPVQRDWFWKCLDLSQLSSDQYQNWKDSFLGLLKRLTYRDRRQILIKSPSHTYHIPQILELFPDARFVYIHRNPYHVFRSSVHLRRRGIEENCLGKSEFEFEGHEEDVIASFKYGFEKYERDRRLIPDNRLHEVAFEDLEVDPLATIESIYESLELPGFDVVEKALTPEIEKLRAYRKNQFADDPAWVNRVYEELQAFYERFGYPAPDTAAPSVKQPVSQPYLLKTDSPRKPSAASAELEKVSEKAG
ncbi:MAG: sulfotransferase [Planctomycetaceae bacterium]|nr:sulfotransferase [Planctomycetaceae bacterium]